MRKKPDRKKMDLIIRAIYDDVAQLRHSEIMNILALDAFKDSDHQAAVGEVRQAYADARMTLLRAEDRFRTHYLMTHPSFVEAVDNES